MTKRLYEVAKEYGVSTTIVRKTIEDHQIKAGNFTSIDDKMKGILDAAFKKGPKGDAKADRKPERKPESRPERKTEKKNLELFRVIPVYFRDLCRCRGKKKLTCWQKS